METLLQLDYKIFEWINSDWQNAFFDQIMPIWRTKESWIPLYMLLVVSLLYKYKIKGLYLVLTLVMVVGISDIVSSKVVKPSVERLRPCKNPELKSTSRLLINCGSGFSFTSSHAANHFALAVFLLLSLGRQFKYLKLPLLFWAGSIALAQVYVGVHYPLDIFGGAILGSLIAYFIFRLYIRFDKIKITF